MCIGHEEQPEDGSFTSEAVTKDQCYIPHGSAMEADTVSECKAQNEKRKLGST